MHKEILKEKSRKMTKGIVKVISKEIIKENSTEIFKNGTREIKKCFFFLLKELLKAFQEKMAKLISSIKKWAKK